VRDESLLSYMFGTHVSTAPERYGDHATSLSPHSGHRRYYPPAHRH
jgi:hypothetical protein